MTKQTLDLSLKQNLVLTPQLQQAIKLLNMNALEVEQAVTQMLAQNFMLNPDTEMTLDTLDEAPLAESEQSLQDSLDETLDESLEQSLSEMDDEPWEEAFDSDWKQLQSPPSEDTNVEDYLASTQTLNQFLLEQIAQMPIEPRLAEMATLLVYHLTDDGYLREDLSKLATTYHVSAELLQQALAIIRQCQPTGVGARDLQDCLELQLRALPEQTPHLENLQRIMQRHFAFIGKNPELIKRRLSLSNEQYDNAMSLLRSLNPSPGHAYNDGDIQYIKPDIIVREHHGISYVESSDSLKIKLSINQTYAALADEATGQDKTLLSAQLQEAKWFMGALEKRADTIKNVASAVVALQQAFFQQGEVAMKPLTRQKVADMLDIHESTVSRAVNGKYLLCKRGLFELRYFFSAHIEDSSGTEQSTTAIKAMISEIIEQEDPDKPLSDHKISQHLAAAGHQVARRTISKYREALNIPTSSIRRRDK